MLALYVVQPVALQRLDLRIYDALLPLRRLVEQESIPCNRDKRTRIVKAQLGNNAGIIGAALLGKRKLRK